MTVLLPKPRRWPKILAAVLVLFVLLGAAAAFTLDRILTSAARGQAAELSRRWERPVEVGAVKTTLLGGVGLRVEGVRIGAAPGEPRALFELDRAEVKLELLRALRSGGKDVRIRSAELQGLRVAVVKAKDGATNVDRFTAAMAKQGPPERPAAERAAPAVGEKPADLSQVRVDHAAILDARIAFVDESAGGKELYVDDLDLVVDGLAAGAPLDLVLKAGVLSAKQNLEVRVHAPPLPATLVPSPDRVTLKVEPIDLTPLAAFVPRSAGFRGGRFAADLEVALGAAVPGGAGPTTVRGGFQATALRFDGQEGGKALDVTLDADLTADALKGDLTLAKLLVAFGPAALEGKGRVTGLLTESPRIEGLRVVSMNLDVAALAPYYPPLTRLLGGTLAGPIGLSLQAAGTAERPVVELRMDLTPVRLVLPKQAEKAAGGKLSLVARLRGGAGGALRVDAEGDLTGLDLRPGGTLAKKPGDRFTFSVAAGRTVTGPTQRLELASFAMALGGMNVKGRGSTELAPKSTRFDLSVEIDRVDVDGLLLPSKEERAPAGEEPKGRPASASTWAGLSGKASLRIGELVVQKQRLTEVRATVALKEDEVTVEEGRLGLWDGIFSVAGTRARLAPADLPFTLALKVERAEVGGAIAAFTDKKVLTGRLDADVKLSGSGETTDAILRSLDGTIEGRLLDGFFHGKELIAEVAEPLVRALPSLKGKLTKGGKTTLGKVLPVSLRIQGGRALLVKPLEFEERGAATRVQGSFGLDGELELPTTLSLSPAAVSDLTGGKAKIDAPLPFSFKLEGKAWSPRLAGLDVRPAAKLLAEKLGAQALGKALGLEGSPQEGAKAKAAEVKEQAKEQADEQAAAAKEKAGEATKKLEKDVKKKLKGLLGR